MRQVLFHIPVLGYPIYGYGLMLCLALFACGWFAARNARKQGKDGNDIWDLLVWLVIPGLLTARLFYVIQYRDQFQHWYEIFFLWEGGLVVYGSVIGGLAGLILFARKKKLKVLWLLDLAAPVLGLGMALGRIGCLLNGCCYGDYCEQPWAIQFPAASPPHQRLVARGMQSPLGFIIDAKDRKVIVVEPGSTAEQKGIALGDQIVSINDKSLTSARDLSEFFTEVDRSLFYARSVDKLWPMKVTASRGNENVTVYVDAPRSLSLHPTQIYSSINGFLLFFMLASWYPYRTRDGEMISLFAMCYSVTRFLIEYLRYDEIPFSFDGLTISQNLSVLMFGAGLALFLYVRLAKPATTSQVQNLAAQPSSA